MAEFCGQNSNGLQNLQLFFGKPKNTQKYSTQKFQQLLNLLLKQTAVLIIYDGLFSGKSNRVNHLSGCAFVPTAVYMQTSYCYHAKGRYGAVRI